MNSTLQKIILSIPEGYSEVVYLGSKYSLTKQLFNHGRSMKVFAQELKGTDFISFNYYKTSNQAMLKPCEMPEQKVVDFLNNFNLIIR